MSSGRTDFFMSASEFRGWLRQQQELSNRRFFRTDDGAAEPLPSVSNDASAYFEPFHIAAPTRDGVFLNLSVAGANWVLVVPPEELASGLIMGSILPARKSCARHLYAEIRATIRRHAPLSTWATNKVTGKSALYDDVWSSKGAAELASQGHELRQQGVANISYQPDTAGGSHT